jgi:hypothetical protein
MTDTAQAVGPNAALAPADVAVRQTSSDAAKRLVVGHQSGIMRRRLETNQTPGAHRQTDRRRRSIARSSSSVLAAVPVIANTARELAFIGDVTTPFPLREPASYALCRSKYRGTAQRGAAGHPKPVLGVLSLRQPHAFRLRDAVRIDYFHSGQVDLSDTTWWARLS